LWPYLAKTGRKSYVVGFYDHDRRERSRSFPTVRHARAWMSDYVTAERRGRESLRRFLLDLDAKDANVAEEARTIAEVLELYLALDAHPGNEGGLAPSTYDHYEGTIARHILGKLRRTQGSAKPPLRYALAVALVAAARFNEPQAPRAWREDMLSAGVPKPTRDQAWSVLSAALSWAAGSHLVPEIQTNGCGLANEPRGNRRRSMRHGGTGYVPARRHRGQGIVSWALSPQAVEAIRAEMLAPVKGRREIIAFRNAMIVSLQYGLGARNQEVWGLRWASLDGEFAWVLEVLSNGQLGEWGKTERSTQRRTAMPGILREDLAAWRAALRDAGQPARECDFIIPGDLTSSQHGVRDRRTGACHFSESQAHSWGARFFSPAVKRAAQRPELVLILGATPYALRRGGISLRLRAEDPQTVASECGTSLKMLSDHYAYAIEDLRRTGPRPADIEWRAARATETQRSSPEHDTAVAAQRHALPRRKVRDWLAAVRRRPLAS
jgi:integrase